MLDLIKRFSALYFTEVLGFCLMGNHFHLLVKMIPDLYARSRLALPGTTTGATIAVVIFGGIGLKVSLSIKVRH
jgi:REP element-mobilizing transposase RayT